MRERPTLTVVTTSFQSSDDAVRATNAINPAPTTTAMVLMYRNDQCFNRTVTCNILETLFLSELTALPWDPEVL